MTREKAINELKTGTCYECTYGCMSIVNCENEKCSFRQAVLMAIKVLEELKTGELDKVVDEETEIKPQESDIEKLKPCINYEDGCEEWAGCPCVYYKARK